MINNTYVGIIILLCYSVGFILCLPSNTSEMHTAFDTTNDTIPFEPTKTDIQCVNDAECGSNSRCYKNYCECFNGYIFDLNIHICVEMNAKPHTSLKTILTWIGIALAIAIVVGVAIKCCCCGRRNDYTVV